MNKALMNSQLGNLIPRRGKVRDVYDIGDDLLIVATDRISAFDVVMPNGIPDKGKILTGISLFWFDVLGKPDENHLITDDVDSFPDVLSSYKEQLQGRSMLVKRAEVIPFECIVRGYLAGSAWKEYQHSWSVCGIPLPQGLHLSQKFPKPLFTPSTKAEQGNHDQNISFKAMVNAIGVETANVLRDRSLDLYTRAARYALNKGIIIADTKFEFGRLPDGRIILIDEVLTPDSSRFWPADNYQVGQEQPSFDKQYLRNWLSSIAWNKTPPGPQLPDRIVQETLIRYQYAYELITGVKYSM